MLQSIEFIRGGVNDYRNKFEGRISPVVARVEKTLRRLRAGDQPLRQPHSHYESEKPVYDLNAVTEHVRNSLNWVSVEVLQHDYCRSCIDGRDRNGVVSVPGGDAAEFITLLSSAREAGLDVDVARMRDYMREYAACFGKFFMHTDSHAVEKIGHILKEYKKIGVGSSDAEVFSFLRKSRSDKEEKAFLLGILCHPDMFGCGHLKLMFQQPQEYNIDEGIAYNFMRAFYEEMWSTDVDKTPVEYRMLDGAHNEGAVVIVSSDVDLNNTDSNYPVMKPSAGNSSVFVYFQDVAQQIRVSSRTEDFLSRCFNADGDVAGCFREIYSHNADRQISSTMRALASHCTIFKVHIPKSAEHDPSRIQVSEFASVVEYTA